MKQQKYMSKYKNNNKIYKNNKTILLLIDGIMYIYRIRVMKSLCKSRVVADLRLKDHSPSKLSVYNLVRIYNKTTTIIWFN